MLSVEIAAVKIGDGSFELMRLDDAVNTTMSIDRLEARDKAQLESAIRSLLPEMELSEAMRRVFAGAVAVPLDSWLSVKQMLAH
jgi:hypothetical protein